MKQGETCKWCKREIGTVDNCEGNKFVLWPDHTRTAAIPYSSESKGLCPTCGVAPGRNHHLACD